jgi:iron complex outermembrane receptor protein
LDWGGRLFGALRNLDNRLPFTAAGSVDLRRAFGGGGLYAGWKAPFAGGNWRTQVGVDAERQSDNRARYDNLEGARGPLALDQLETFDKFGIWTIQQWTHGRLSMMGSLRADHIRIRADDRFLADGDQSGTKTFRRISPMVGCVWQPTPTQSLYVNLASNFETPTLNELSNNPDGGGFVDLQPQRSQNFELGFKQAATRFLQAEVALFHIRLQDEIVPYQLPEFPGRNFFRNAGRSQRNGLEAALRVFPNARWSIHTTYTWSDFRYQDYTANGQAFNGKQLPGIPRHQAQGELRYQHKGVFIAFQARYIGALFVSDNNDESAEGALLFNLRQAWTVQLKKYRLEPFLGIQNLLNQPYYGNILINAAARRYYEPGTAINFWVGVKAEI